MADCPHVTKAGSLSSMFDSPLNSYLLGKTGIVGL